MCRIKIALFLLLSTLATSAGEAGLPIAVRSTNGTARGVTLTGAVTNLVVGATKIIGTDAQSREKGVTLSGLTWDGTTLALYSAPTITSFVNDHPSVEIGATVSDTVFDWTLGGGAITSQSLNQGIGALAIGLRTYTDTADYTTTRTYTLTVGDGTTTVQANSAVTFLNKAYWGDSANTSLTDGQVIALSKDFYASRTVIAPEAAPKTITCAAEYMYFAYPASFGAATFIVNGLLNTAWTLVTRDFVNASGATVSYRIYRSDNLLTGTYIVEIQ